VKAADLKVGEIYVHLRGGSRGVEYVAATYRLVTLERFDQSRSMRPTHREVTLPDGKVVEVYGAVPPFTGKKGTHLLVENAAENYLGNRYTLVTPAQLAMTLYDRNELSAKKDAAKRERDEATAEKSRIRHERYRAVVASLEAAGVEPPLGSMTLMKSDEVLVTLDVLEQIAAALTGDKS
jgi:hypothetical protein